jgi:hypothetical protein
MTCPDSVLVFYQGPVRHEKCTEEIKLWLPEKLKSDLKTYALRRGHESLSTAIRQMLREALYGQLDPNPDARQGAVRDA